MIQRCIELLERNYTYRVTTPCEPQLGKRGLYPTLSTREAGYSVRGMTNVLAYSDGSRDLVDLATHVGLSGEEAVAIAEQLFAHGLLARADG
jgi:aminopeptidase-like protein